MDLVGWPPDHLLWFLPSQLFHGRVVVLLTLRQKHLQDSTLVLLFQSVEVVNDDTNEQVQREEASANNKDNKVEVVVLAGLPFRLLVNFPTINCISHDFNPT